MERRNDQKPREELLKWSFDQGMPLSVYLQTETGLKFVDYFNLPGPMADKEDILNIDLSGIHSDKINLKLVTGVLFWDIDYVGMDFTSTVPIKTTAIPCFQQLMKMGTTLRRFLQIAMKNIWFSLSQQIKQI